MTAGLNQMLIGFIAVTSFAITESTVFFRKDGLTSSVFSPGVKDYPFPVKLVRVTNTVAVPVPYPVHVTRKIPYPITVTKPVPYPVPHPVPVQVTKPVLIRQAVPVPVVKPLVIPQPIFHPNHHALAAHQAYNNNYMNFIKNQAYNQGFHHNAHVAPFLNNNNSNTGQTNQDPDDSSFDNFDINDNYGNEYGQGNLDDGFDMPSRTILPPSISSEYGSNEFGSTEADSIDEGTANSHEIYKKQVAAAIVNSEENQGSSSQQDEDDLNDSSTQQRN